MNKAAVTFQVMDNNIKTPCIYKGMPIETVEFENSMFSKIEFIGSKLYVGRYKIDIYGVKTIKNSNIPITKELEDFICSVVDNSKYIKENNIKSYKLIIYTSTDYRGIIEIDNYVKDNYNILEVSSYGKLSMRFKSNKDFLL